MIFRRKKGNDSAKRQSGWLAKEEEIVAFSVKLGRWMHPDVPLRAEEGGEEGCDLEWPPHVGPLRQPYVGPLTNGDK